MCFVWVLVGEELVAVGEVELESELVRKVRTKLPLQLLLRLQRIRIEKSVSFLHCALALLLPVVSITETGHFFDIKHVVCVVRFNFSNLKVFRCNCYREGIALLLRFLKHGCRTYQNNSLPVFLEFNLRVLSLQVLAESLGACSVRIEGFLDQRVELQLLDGDALLGHGVHHFVYQLDQLFAAL